MLLIFWSKELRKKLKGITAFVDMNFYYRVLLILLLRNITDRNNTGRNITTSFAWEDN